MSAHRDPDVVADYCKNARMRGLRVIIAGAGISAALPGVAAAHTDLPVIGVPLSEPPDRGGRARRDPLDRPDAARRAGRLRRPGQPAQRRAPRAAHPAGVSIRTLSTPRRLREPLAARARGRDRARGRLARRLRGRREERRFAVVVPWDGERVTLVGQVPVHGRRGSPGSSRRARSTTAAPSPRRSRATELAEETGLRAGALRAPRAALRLRVRACRARASTLWLATDLEQGEARPEATEVGMTTRRGDAATSSRR